jgi:hypothetical protein
MSNPLTQVEVLDPASPHHRTILSTKAELENAILKCNQHHARQYLNTPFASDPYLSNAVNPKSPTNQIEEIVNGNFLPKSLDHCTLSDIEQQWINELTQQINTNIDTYIMVQQFISFFKKRKEKTASSFSGRHLGHYKVIAELAHSGHTDIAETIVNLINIAIIASRPLHRWKQSMKVMIEKGKGDYIENLCIIQLCEADLNFVLNEI